MKTLKILFAAIIFVGFATTSMAQEITAHAEVIEEIEWVAGDEQNLNFGVLRVDQTKSISLNADGTVTAGGDAENLTTGITAGRVAFTVGIGANITIGFSAIGGITSDLDANYQTYWTYDINAANANLMPGNTANFSTTQDKVYVYVDGAINATGVGVGVYQDNITITAEYN